ncbi:protein phosphatase 1 regulatory subunit 1A isoform X3 [Meriones unguiculatus]|uniref:protein phosphatase 1 regulatory subunit 1A isoform X3 n=1 Tax=Meriones unguiculatus TaxID=10047 RepID=UPI000B4F20E1|nr:protein phosphatase 1 regulatory subunit 1A isoform X3 [Meriones unguiculatus]
MEPDNSPRKIQFTVPLLEPHLDPEAAEQIRRRRPTPATLVLTSDQSSPEIDEDRIPNPLLKSTLSMSPRQRKKMTRTTPTMKEPAESTPKTQEQCGVEPSTEDPSAHMPPLDSHGASLVSPVGWALGPLGEQAVGASIWNQKCRQRSSFI